ncbi:nitrilase-related carbon-nitrogen hydrolase, partial [Arthrospira platensis SPKY2]
NVFETPFGRIAIQVCYDIEFPEISRMLTLAGVEVIFVPFSTDERRAYQRVRYTARARAVENSIYTVLSGNVGNLPNRSYLLNYGQAAIFTPSDFEFPVNAIAGEAEPNIETVVISDLDLSSLTVNRSQGNTRPLYDRRT